VIIATSQDYPNRPVTSHLNYKGDHRHLIDVPLGPNTYRELCYPVEVVYDQLSNTSVVGISNIAPPQ
jgi:hypothetical protein